MTTESGVHYDFAKIKSGTKTNKEEFAFRSPLIFLTVIQPTNIQKKGYTENFALRDSKTEEDMQKPSPGMETPLLHFHPYWERPISVGRGTLRNIRGIIEKNSAEGLARHTADMLLPWIRLHDK